MAEIINLNKARKARAKADGEEVVKANRVKFGRTRQEKEAARREAERKAQDLDGKKLDE
jgi:hypothetical protein